MSIKNTDSIINEIQSLIEKSEDIIIISHENPDGDSIGSSLAMYSYINSKDKKVNIYFPNSIPEQYSFLSNIESINIYSEFNKLEFNKADLFIILDVNTFHRIGEMGVQIPELLSNDINKKLILIDHHLSPQINANISLIDSNASSTGELVYKVIFSDSNFKFNKTVAEAIYTAILTDTGGFRHNSTTSNSHSITSKLMEYNINITEIYNNIYLQMPHKIFKIMGRAFLSSKLYHNGKLNIMYLSEDDLEEFDVIPEELNNFSETTLNIKDTLAGILITKHKSKDYFKLSFRSKGNINIREIAQFYGGGGHFNAAGGKEYKLNINELILDLVEKTKVLFY